MAHSDILGEANDDVFKGATVTFTAVDGVLKKLFNIKVKLYAVHGFGCDNWSKIVESEKALKKLLKEKADDEG